MSITTTPPPDRAETLPEQATRPAVLAAWLNQVEAALADRPQDTALAWRRAGLLRALGRLEAATAAYEAVGSPAALDLAALLRGAAVGEAGPAGPARFVRVPGVLEPAQYRELWDLVAGAALDPAQIGGKGEERLEPGARQAALLQDVAPLRSWFLALVTDLAVRARVPERLGLEALPAGLRELQVTRHLDGGFYRLHYDAGKPGDPSATRRLTYVYYFHRMPRRFAGGDLLLCDQGPDGRRAAELGFTRLEPMDNSLVFFASDRLHAVTPVTMQSSDPLDGRWTVNGWLHRL